MRRIAGFERGIRFLAEQHMPAGFQDSADFAQHAFRMRIGHVLQHGEGHVDLMIDSLDLVEGTYKLDAAVHKRDGYPYDYHRLLYTFRVKSRTKDVGIFRPPHRWSFSQNVKLKSNVA